MRQFSSNAVDLHQRRPRTRRLASAAGGLLLAALTTAPALAGPATPVLSGVGWRSGATAAGFPCLAQLRGRPLDVGRSFLVDTSFDNMVRQSAGWLRARAKQAPLWVVSMGLLPSGNVGQFDQCAAGAFDGYFRQIGANLQKAGAQGTIVLPGWEANIGSHSHPWGVDHASQIPAYLGCWRHAAAALKQGGPAIKVEFNSAKVTRNPEFKSLDLYPGDDLVDGWSIQFYDGGPLKTTQAVWDKFYNRTYNGDLWGLGTWLAAAKAHGKTFSVTEWGVWRQGDLTLAQADEPVFVDNMYRFFRDNAASIGYETYFDTDAQNGEHALCHNDGTPTSFPNAAATYARDWSLGQ